MNVHFHWRKKHKHFSDRSKLCLVWDFCQLWIWFTCDYLQQHRVCEMNPNKLQSPFSSWRRDMSPTATLWLTDIFFLSTYLLIEQYTPLFLMFLYSFPPSRHLTYVYNNFWTTMSSMAQRNKVYRCLDIHTLVVNSMLFLGLPQS